MPLDEVVIQDTTRTADNGLSSSWIYFKKLVYENNRKIVLLAAAYVFMLSVIGMQNVPFWDDSRRRLNGVSGWGPWDGRWGSELVSWLLNSGTSVVDLGLTTFVVSALVMALASVIVLWALVGERANWLTWVLALVFGLNPWVLNALAFRFDGPFMALSVLFAVSIIFFYRSQPLWLFIGSLLLAFIVANFFQSSIGLILTLLMTKSLLDWLRADRATNWILRRLAAGFGGVAVGVLLYFAQSRLLGTGREGWFDLRHPFGAFPNNLFHFLRVFVQDNASSWLVFTALVFLLAIYSLWQQSGRGALHTFLVILGYLIVSILASGGILLFATAEHISVQARFRFPLAMGIVMLAMVAASNGYRRPITLIAKLGLIGFAYLWLMPVFLFAQVLGEQHDSLRTQATIIFSDVFRIYRSGDTVLYEPNVFTNSLVSQRISERFPIFNNPSYIGRLNQHNDNVRERMVEFLPIPPDALLATNDRPGVCDFRPAGTEPPIIGARWEVWRADQQTVCVTFPPLAHQEINTRDLQVFSIPVGTLPQGTLPQGNIPGGIVDTSLRGLTVAIWPVEHPDQLQWASPVSADDNAVTFEVAAPAEGWQGSAIVAHFFVSQEFWFQQIWPFGN